LRLVSGSQAGLEQPERQKIEVPTTLSRSQTFQHQHLHEPGLLEFWRTGVTRNRIEQSLQMRKLAMCIDFDAMIAQICAISEGWFGVQIGKSDEGGSFKGVTTRDICTKAAHLILVKELLSEGRIVRTTEQKATLPPLVPRIFEQEIRQDRFAWMVLSINKKARKVTSYRKKRMRFHNDRLYAGRFKMDTTPQEVSGAVTRPLATGKPFQISSDQIDAFASMWGRSPAQVNGGLDKVVGFPILPRGSRRGLKTLPKQIEEIPQETRVEQAP